MMKYTLFDTPVLRTVMSLASTLILKLIGWKREGSLPDIPKYVAIAAPHTTNWDLPLTLFVAFSFRIKVYWMGKETIFKKPFGTIMRWLGGIPVDRSRSNNMVEETIKVFNSNEKMVMVIPPEGTRNKVNYWKTGFYHIAHGAGVPILCSFLDYKRKAGGVGPVINPTGDIDADMKLIQDFYKTVIPKYPEKTAWGYVARKGPGKKIS